MSARTAAAEPLEAPRLLLTEMARSGPSSLLARVRPPADESGPKPVRVAAFQSSV